MKLEQEKYQLKYCTLKGFKLVKATDESFHIIYRIKSGKDNQRDQDDVLFNLKTYCHTGMPL